MYAQEPEFLEAAKAAALQEAISALRTSATFSGGQGASEVG
jgi:hypothetical protein